MNDQTEGDSTSSLAVSQGLEPTSEFSGIKKETE